MDLDSLRAFVRVAELGSYTRASEQLGMSKSRASLRIQALEDELGTQLLSRSTRTVRLTADGRQLIDRAKRLLHEADEVSALFQASRQLRGTVRVDAPISITRELLIPRLPELLSAHPQLQVLLSATDRRVDLLRDGFDCVLRVGQVADSGLIARKLGTMSMVNCASPDYLAKHGTPRTLADLERHWIVNYSIRLGDESPSFEYQHDSQTAELAMRSLITVNNTDAYRAACLAGLGIIQVPRRGVRDALAAGALIEVLPEARSAPMPVSLVYTRGAPRRVRAVMSWMTEVVADYLA